MATTTPNFGWTVPTSSDLVKNGATAIETLGDSIDASLVDLKGGTTDQVLAKNSNTDMDFKWVTDASGMTNPMTTTGDVIYSSSGSTPARLGIGTAGQVLQVNSGATAPEWAAPAEPVWTTWSPTVTGLTKGNGTEVARYRNNGKMVDIFYQFTLGSTSSITGQVYLTPPINSIYDLAIACAYFSEAGVADVPAGIFMPKSVIYPKTMGTAAAFMNQAQLNASTPFTWGTGDFFNFNFSYEVA